MDVSPVSRCSSDFSIARILSEDPGNGKDAEVPSWLCCTRYRPPRLPRSANSACRARRSGRHARVPFTAAQAAALEAAYARAPYLAPPALRALAAALQLRDDRIKIWFQNRRARERREKSANIAPPREVALPPTQLLTPSITGPWKLHSDPIHSSRVECNSGRENPAEDRGAPYDLTVARSTFYPQAMAAPVVDNDDTCVERSETPLDIESIDD